MGWKAWVIAVPTVTGSAFGLKELITRNSLLPPPQKDIQAPSVGLVNQEQRREEEVIGLSLSQDTIQSSQEDVINLADDDEYIYSRRKGDVRKEAKEALDRLNDYSFKIFFPCGIGTGWILDYQLTDDGKYPTTWYIGTNAHVVNSFRFSDNPYDQRLPYYTGETNKLRWMNDKVNYSDVELWTGKSCRAVKGYGYLDIGLSKPETGEKHRPEYGFIRSKKIKEPKLFYMPYNFLKPNASLGIPDHNYRDFAVLEIEFSDPETAKELTNDFANKYKVDSTNAINIFANPIDSKYSLEKLDDANENFYTVAYPHTQKDKYTPAVNFDVQKAEASNLTKEMYYLSGERIRGYVDAKKLEDRHPSLKTEWNGKELSEVGHLYWINKFALEGGSSGSLYTDKDGNVLGVKRLAEWVVSNHSGIVPLRSNEIKKDGVIYSPKYDLILGSENQTSSYKQQVERYITKYGKRTWLSAREWKHKSK
ncbi:hypothetical protein WEN_03075 [Mycoplasma wenyonii str. Massachusetts]|uniref:DUF31 domain-containing protein n=1 Tax=Mycoplasma wenyonii (strain Massachusetts) TaxID=1197325 RepID=I6YBL3_MYCWM|nr:hypothetical protein [Mycoplasma wenyonii]AFN65396.1 hypothetical protein WEN_03075 [Mycoplasma wenyonii str. Massachusetts]